MLIGSMTKKGLRRKQREATERVVARVNQALDRGDALTFSPEARHFTLGRDNPIAFKRMGLFDGEQRLHYDGHAHTSVCEFAQDEQAFPLFVAGTPVRPKIHLQHQVVSDKFLVSRNAKYHSPFLVRTLLPGPTEKCCSHGCCPSNGSPLLGPDNLILPTAPLPADRSLAGRVQRMLERLNERFKRDFPAK